MTLTFKVKIRNFANFAIIAYKIFLYALSSNLT
jgi:hypothetical protein